MIDFACKQFKIEEIVKCSLGLTKADYIVLKSLAEQEKAMTAAALVKKLELDLSTVQRSVKRLHEKKALTRLQQNLSGGGYQFTYLAKKQLIRQLVKQTIHHWATTVEKRLDEW